VAFGIESAGRWSELQGDETDTKDRVLAYAWVLLNRYGVVFKRLLARETNVPAWRDLLLAYRRLEARGEIRGGRFVAGMSGEQFALAGAVGQLRAIRKSEREGRLISISAADPLNLHGIVTPGERVPALKGNRILFEDGVPVLALIAGEVTPLGSVAPARVAELKPSLIRRPLASGLRAHLAMGGTLVGANPLAGTRQRRPRKTPQFSPAGKTT
jgi:ATP-dependent Lhr-like helicase